MKTQTRLGSGAQGQVEWRRLKADASNTDVQGNMHVWFLLQAVEQTLEIVSHTFKTTFSQYSISLKTVSFQLMELPKKGEIVTLETRLVQIERKKFQFRIYAFVHREGHKSKKVCRAKYDYNAVGLNALAQAV
jgi:hypothetical protein